MTGMAVLASDPEIIVAVIDGQIETSADGGRRWQPRGPGEAKAPAGTRFADAEGAKRGLGAPVGRLYGSGHLGTTRRPPWGALPQPATAVRGIAANAEARVLLVATNAGLYRSDNGGESWILKEDNLPIHLEAGPLARDPGDAGLVYAVYSLMPYAEVWRSAIEG